uniref:Uncharacterized protein n=1 Tax=Chromera velia CCMP2878 TaxID=1169474 RepID=A0A0G4HEQ5_9ALVE|eukprot:Cvel_26853.t1-p1 / transcript=Cvel_26853.t1 / gene=Cvel_26853 / organism=Chromera_velia_CCMP2878 / gene_product=hypothetical protein / transcript_product=hypothetical protein / location=Cvel_scaffold3256:4986-14923(-) / protein_length=1739 / sequence_SO=supercontig / SO=protein_coding / is_pseudo=false
MGEERDDSSGRTRKVGFLRYQYLNPKFISTLDGTNVEGYHLRLVKLGGEGAAQPRRNRQQQNPIVQQQVPSDRMVEQWNRNAAEIEHMEMQMAHMDHVKAWYEVYQNKYTQWHQQMEGWARHFSHGAYPGMGMGHSAGGGGWGGFYDQQAQHQHYAPHGHRGPPQPGLLPRPPGVLPRPPGFQQRARHGSGRRAPPPPPQPVEGYDSRAAREKVVEQVKELLQWRVDAKFGQATSRRLDAHSVAKSKEEVEKQAKERVEKILQTAKFDQQSQPDFDSEHTKIALSLAALLSSEPVAGPTRVLFRRPVNEDTDMVGETGNTRDEDKERVLAPQPDCAEAGPDEQRPGRGAADAVMSLRPNKNGDVNEKEVVRYLTNRIIASKVTEAQNMSEWKSARGLVPLFSFFAELCHVLEPPSASSLVRRMFESVLMLHITKEGMRGVHRANALSLSSSASSAAAGGSASVLSRSGENQKEAPYFLAMALLCEELAERRAREGLLASSLHISQEHFSYKKRVHSQILAKVVLSVLKDIRPKIEESSKNTVGVLRSASQRRVGEWRRANEISAAQLNDTMTEALDLFVRQVPLLALCGWDTTSPHLSRLQCLRPSTPLSSFVPEAERPPRGGPGSRNLSQGGGGQQERWENTRDADGPRQERTDPQPISKRAGWDSPEYMKRVLHMIAQTNKGRMKGQIGEIEELFSSLLVGRRGEQAQGGGGTKDDVTMGGAEGDQSSQTQLRAPPPPFPFPSSSSSRPGDRLARPKAPPSGRRPGGMSDATSNAPDIRFDPKGIGNPQDVTMTQAAPDLSSFQPVQMNAGTGNERAQGGGGRVSVTVRRDKDKPAEDSWTSYFNTPPASSSSAPAAAAAAAASASASTEPPPPPLPSLSQQAGLGGPSSSTSLQFAPQALLQPSSNRKRKSEAEEAKQDDHLNWLSQRMGSTFSTENPFGAQQKKQEGAAAAPTFFAMQAEGGGVNGGGLVEAEGEDAIIRSLLEEVDRQGGIEWNLQAFLRVGKRLSNDHCLKFAKALREAKACRWPAGLGADLLRGVNLSNGDDSNNRDLKVETFQEVLQELSEGVTRSSRLEWMDVRGFEWWCEIPQTVMIFEGLVKKLARRRGRFWSFGSSDAQGGHMEARGVGGDGKGVSIVKKTRSEREKIFELITTRPVRRIFWENLMAADLWAQAEELSRAITEGEEILSLCLWEGVGISVEPDGRARTEATVNSHRLSEREEDTEEVVAIFRCANVNCDGDGVWRTTKGRAVKGKKRDNCSECKGLELPLDGYSRPVRPVTAERIGLYRCRHSFEKVFRQWCSACGSEGLLIYCEKLGGQDRSGTHEDISCDWCMETRFQFEGESEQKDRVKANATASVQPHVSSSSPSASAAASASVSTPVRQSRGSPNTGGKGKPKTPMFPAPLESDKPKKKPEGPLTDSQLKALCGHSQSPLTLSQDSYGSGLGAAASAGLSSSSASLSNSSSSPLFQPVNLMSQKEKKELELQKERMAREEKMKRKKEQEEGSKKKQTMRDTESGEGEGNDEEGGQGGVEGILGLEEFGGTAPLVSAPEIRSPLDLIAEALHNFRQRQTFGLDQQGQPAGSAAASAAAAAAATGGQSVNGRIFLQTLQRVEIRLRLAEDSHVAVLFHQLTLALARVKASGGGQCSLRSIVLVDCPSLLWGDGLQASLITLCETCVANDEGRLGMGMTDTPGRSGLTVTIGSTGTVCRKAPERLVRVLKEKGVTVREGVRGPSD